MLESNCKINPQFFYNGLAGENVDLISPGDKFLSEEVDKLKSHYSEIIYCHSHEAGIGTTSPDGFYLIHRPVSRTGKILGYLSLPRNTKGHTGIILLYKDRLEQIVLFAVLGFNERKKTQLV